MINRRFCLILLLFFYQSRVIPSQLPPDRLPRNSYSLTFPHLSQFQSSLLLVADLEGRLYALNKFTGTFLWKNSLIPGALFSGTYKDAAISNSLPLYVFEPFLAGSIYAYVPNGGLQKLPVTIKELVDQSPLRWPDGTLFLGHKTSYIYALDMFTGRELFRYEQGIMDSSYMDSLVQSSSHPLLLAKTMHSLSCFSPLAKDSALAARWNVTLAEYSGIQDPFRVTHDNSTATEIIETSQVVKIFTSFNGLFFARDSVSGQVLWVRKISSPAIAFFSIDSSTNHAPTLKAIPISSYSLEQHQNSEGIIDPRWDVLVNIGRSADMIFALPSTFFPFLRNIFDRTDAADDGADINDIDANYINGSKEPTLTRLGNLLSAPNLPGKAIELDRDLSWPETLYDNQCIPGEANFPACLEGSKIARVFYPLPALEPPQPSNKQAQTQESKINPIFSSFIITVLILFLSSGYFLILLWKRFKARTGNIAHDLDSIISRPPGFEEIPLHSADIFYAAQSSFDPNSLPKSFLVSDEIIGYGSHGTVVLKGLFDGRPVAVKRMLIDFYQVAGHEVKLLQQSDHHPNVIRYFCRDVTDKFVYIVLELCICSLADIVEKTASQNLDQISNLLADTKSLLHQITEGLGHLHEMKLIHRDIKPHNILITPQGRPVLSDFGVSKRLAEDQTSFHPTVQSGTIGWRAPECIVAENATNFAAEANELLPRSRLDKMVDIFALGCVFYYVLSKGEHPFGGRLTREMNIIRNNYKLEKLSYSPEAMDLIARMIRQNPEQRPTCQEILLHPYFWSTQTQISFFLDVSDRLEYEDKLSCSEILTKLERRRLLIFDGNPVWHRKIDLLVWEDLKSYRRYNVHSVRDLIRAIRNKRNHFHELSLLLKQVMGETPEQLIKYFLDRFPHLLIEMYRLAEETFMKDVSPFAGVYFLKQI